MANRNLSTAKQLNERVQRHPDGTVERWRDVLKFRGVFRVSDCGRVKSTGRWVNRGLYARRWVVGRIIPPVKHCKTPYLAVSLASCGTSCYILLHRLVLETFIGPCPLGMETRHLDGNPLNNCLSNLCWGTNAENHADRRRHGTLPSGERVYHAKVRNADIPIIHSKYRAGMTMKELYEEYGAGIAGILRGESYRDAQPVNPAEIRKRGASGARNSKARPITFNGRTMILKDWAVEIGITGETLHERIENWGVELALTTPKLRRYKGRRK